MQTRPFDLQLVAAPMLSYALAHNRQSVLTSVTITNSGPAVRAAVLRLTVESAGQSLAAACEILVDLAAQRPVTLTELNLRGDPAIMLTVEEQRPATIHAALSIGDEVVAEARHDIQLLAAQQWIARPVELGLEMLSAHVLPNHPAISTLLAETADLLERTTGSGSLQGYQAGETRVDQIVEAVFDAMRGHGIRYSNPPASWDVDGQKIRTPGEVLHGRAGTCLDTTVVMAAALEQAGLHPLLIVVTGHAFLGYWREEQTLGSPAVTDVDDVINLIDLGLIALVETTDVTTDRSEVPFAQSQRAPYVAHLTGDLSAVVGIADVVQARLGGIIPLPARTTDAAGTVIVTEYRPAAASTPAAERPGRTPGIGTESMPIPPRVEQWKNSLLDLSLRNRLINFTDRGKLALTVPDRTLSAIEDQVNAGTGLGLVPSDRVSQVDRERGIRFGRDLPLTQLTALLQEKRSVYADVTEAAYDTRLRGLAYKARTIVQETGANNLYLAFGTLVWTVADRELRSPLVLVPVVLEATRGGYRIALDESGQSTPNYCLLEKLRQVHGLHIPGLETPSDDESGLDLEAAFRATREALVEAGLPYRVDETLDLSILQFAKFRLWKDLDDNWQTLAENALVGHLIHSPTLPFTDPAPAPVAPDLDALGAQCPVAGDSSQLAAVAEAVADRTFVLEGPPGTGKSQTITNLLTRAVADGKKVLFVAEKRAALQVVQKRLDEVGMGAFALDLHDKASKPVQVRAQIRRALEHRVDVDAQGLKSDLDQLGTARRSLARYAARLHEQNPAGLSFYSARTQALAAADVPALPVPSSLPATVTPEQLTALRHTLRDLPGVTEPANPRRGHAWAFIGAHSITADALAAIDSQTVAAAAAQLDAACAALPGGAAALGAAEAAAVVATLSTPSEFAALGTLAASGRRPLEVLDTVRGAPWIRDHAAATAAVDAFVQTPHPALLLCTPAALVLDVHAIHAAAFAADSSGFFGRAKRRRAVLAELQATLRPDAQVALRHLSVLTGQLVETRVRLDALHARVSALPGVHLAPDWNPLAAADGTLLAQQLAWLTWAASVVAAPSESTAGAAATGSVPTGSAPTGSAPTALGDEFVAALRAYLGATTESDPDFGAAVSRVAQALQDLSLATSATADELSDWAGPGGLVAAWTTAGTERASTVPGLPSLRRWLALLAHLQPLSALGLTEARTIVLEGTLDSGDATLAFEKGLAVAAHDERGAATALDRFDVDAHNRAITRFTGASAAVRQHLPTFIPSTVLDQRTFGDAVTTGQIGLLKRQLDRQRGGMGVRDLMSTFGDLITEIMPCMLMSPESVARFFPAQAALFDIVVFDEASQVRVADAVGAMGRARSVVVVGDSKQMPPTAFAESSISSLEDEAVSVEFVRDEESILSECVQAQVPSRWLSWHYRSQDESLIAFSNREYYRGALSSFPAPRHGRAGTDTSTATGTEDYGVSLRRVDGTFLRSGVGKALRTNPVEADAVVTEIIRRFADSPAQTPSIGVVTFNLQQRTLIEGLLRDSGDDRITAALDVDTDGLFVKNLENVQGDERDTILFSTAFSADASGRLPLNFGPLNLPGGERRLNVAVTRARRQIIVFSSFAPTDLRSEETVSLGIKHLRKYLDMAALNGTGAWQDEARRGTAIDRHREDIAAALRERGLVVATDVGLSDFRIDLTVAIDADPHHPVMAILLDGPTWAARHTVSDRDGLPVEVLSKLLRWPAVERVWMPAWLEDRESVLDHLTASLAAVKTAPPATPAAPAPSATPTPPAASKTPEAANAAATRLAPVAPVAGRAATTAGLLDGGGSSVAPAGRSTGLERDYHPWPERMLGPISVLDALPARRAAAAVAAALGEIVEAEGPIHHARLAKLLASSFGLTKLSAARSRSILEQLPNDLTGTDSFAWPSRIDPETWRGYRRTPAGLSRPLEQVSPREIVNAMVDLAHTSAGMSEDELKREALGVFGGTRMTAGLVTVLTAALQQGLAEQRLEATDTGIIVARIRE
ncbi:DUF4011 domain-containing protein [Cryobacterium frigoriphilum]|uniref:DUF4011 domain-containing protein n=1 Tax=Cryobacterium frigoriphilum TaxID=1259150 RepID=A0A4R8ZY87_9MICO|nr:DUF3320 domain-containing protein [Cryobacterium frigoriphilum]TFD48811.1 DUF4011 domain-containing protein [Cryobacterium frigoriphilum]